MANRFGICEWSLPEVGADAIRHGAALGFQGIQLTERGGWEADFPLLRPALQDEYRRAREETGITFQALHLWSLCRLASMIHPVQSAAGKVSEACLRAAVQVCADLDIPSIMVTSGFMSQIKNQSDFQIFAQHLKLACDIAGERDVRIVFESALSAAEILQMRELVGPELKICYDIFNPIRFHMDAPETEIPLLGRDLIDHFHLKDGPENMIGCSLLGEGVGNFTGVVDAIQAIDYDGWFITENYYGAVPLNKKGSFDVLATTDLATMQRTFGERVWN